MAITLKNTANGARRNIFGKSAIRYIGFLTAFVGMTILLLKNSATTVVIKLSGIAILLIGTLLVSSNVKRLFHKNEGSKSKDTALYFLLGLLLVAVSIVIFLYGNQISQWINLIVGIVIGLYGLILLIYFLLNKTNKKFYLVCNILISLLLLATGILVALLFKFSNSTYMLVVGIVATTTGAIGLLLY